MPEPSRALADYDLPDLDLPVGLAIVGGAVLGGLAGFLFLTARGSRARHDIAVVIDRLLDGLDTTLASWNDVQQRASDARRSMGTPGPRPSTSADAGLT